MPADVATRTLFILPEKLTQAEFFASLATFTLNNWSPHPTIVPPWVSTPVPGEYDPAGAGIKMDLQYLYVVVLSLGGHDAVETTQRWNLVALSMSLWLEDEEEIREVYRRYLWHYEVYSRQVRRLFVARKRKDRDPREYSVEALANGQNENDREDYQVSCLPWTALDSRVEYERQGVLDGAIVLSDYFSLSPAVQLFIKQQTYLEALEVFTNPAEGPSALFTPPESINPGSAPSLDKELDHSQSPSDEHLPDEVRAYKAAILAENRSYIIRTQVHILPQRLPRFSRAELAHFMYDEVNIVDRRRREREREREPIKFSPSRSEIMAKFGFESGVGKSRTRTYTPANSQDGDEGLTLGEYLDRNSVLYEVGTKAWQDELAEKYGIKPKAYMPAGPLRVEKTKNFQEYIQAYGLNASEVKHFFNERLKLEGGFWKHELGRMEALEKRVRGEPIPTPVWDQVAFDSGSITSSDDSYETDSPIHPPHGFMQRPMSLHEYARRVSKQVKEPLEWGYIAPAELPKDPTSPRGQEAHVQNPNAPRSSMPSRSIIQTPKQSRVSYSKEHDGKVDFRRATMNPETQQHFGPIPNLVAVPTGGSPAGTKSLLATYPQSTSSTVRSGKEFRLYPMVSDPMSNGTRKILVLPTGVQVDITNVNPRNPASYNYTQMWLQQRASDNMKALRGLQENEQHDAKQRMPSGTSCERASDSNLLSKSGETKSLKEKYADFHNLVDRTMEAFQNMEDYSLLAAESRRSLDDIRKMVPTISKNHLLGKAPYEEMEEVEGRGYDEGELEKCNSGTEYEGEE